MINLEESKIIGFRKGSDITLQKRNGIYCVLYRGKPRYFETFDGAKNYVSVRWGIEIEPFEEVNE